MKKPRPGSKYYDPPRATPKRVRAWAVVEMDGSIRTIYAVKSLALENAEPAFGDEVVAGAWAPDPPRRAKRKEVKRGK